jgi:hypothetical protein
MRMHRKAGVGEGGNLEVSVLAILTQKDRENTR